MIPTYLQRDEFLLSILRPSKEEKEDIKRILSELPRKTRAKNPFAGKRHTLESRALMSIARIGNKNCVGRKLSKETKAKIGLAQIGSKRNIGRKLSQETKIKISKSHIGKRMSVEVRMKMSEAQKLRWSKCQLS